MITYKHIPPPVAEGERVRGRAADGGGGMDSWGLLLASEKKEKAKNGEKEKEEEGEEVRDGRRTTRKK